MPPAATVRRQRSKASRRVPFGTTAFKMANDISADQTTEVDRMQRMLTSLPPA